MRAPQMRVQIVCCESPIRRRPVDCNADYGTWTVGAAGTMEQRVEENGNTFAEKAADDDAEPPSMIGLEVEREREQWNEDVSE